MHITLKCVVTKGVQFDLFILLEKGICAKF